MQLNKNRMSHPKPAVERETHTKKPRRERYDIISLVWLHQKQTHAIKKYFHRRKATSILHGAVVRADLRSLE